MILTRQPRLRTIEDLRTSSTRWLPAQKSGLLAVQAERAWDASCAERTPPTSPSRGAVTRTGGSDFKVILSTGHVAADRQGLRVHL